MRTTAVLPRRTSSPTDRGLDTGPARPADRVFFDRFIT
jgi:hypothetical protein